MARIFSGGNVKTLSNVIFQIFRIQEYLTHIININHPDKTPCIYAMWHGHQCCIHGIPNREILNVLISRSRDGEIIADVVERMKYKVIRGSKGKKGAVEASMQMISVLKAGENCAMMVDGPKGPDRVAKDGVVRIAKMAGVPIVPVTWYTTNFTLVKFPSWDGFRLPISNTNLVNLYGEPIYVPEDADEEEIRLKLQASLEDLDKRIPAVFEEVYRFGLWKRRRKK